MAGSPEPQRQPVPPVVALAFTAAAFVALVIAGLGVTGLVMDQDVIAVPESGQLPGGLGIVLSTGAYAAGTFSALRLRHPSFWNAVWIAAASYLAYLIGVCAGVVVTGGDPAVAVGVAGRLAISGFGVVVAVAALVSAWSAIALVRTRSDRPRWPWEHDAGR